MDGRPTDSPGRRPAAVDGGIANPKAVAWNRLGSAYWNRNYDGGPDEAGCAQYLGGVAGGERVLLVGASTVRLARAALDAGARLVVADFSEILLAELEASLGADAARYVRADVVSADPPDVGRFDLIVADRLVNRFTRDEMVRALRFLASAVDVGGRMRLSYRLGLYERDELLLAEARRRGEQAAVFDEAAFDVDYSGASGWLAEVLPRHGDIPVEALVDFYVARGREHRLREGELDGLLAEAVGDGTRYRVAHLPVPGLPADLLLEFTRSA
ncbi:class I SAM-dependent methyltransferase [Actinosynnema sp. NPDC020468]|uniref:class I SAM-dependent methyltransferase n=1 Tax=Actinosynnema sp. NPDC020468 TaxID=3154488 RepID=UPI00340B3122